MQVVSDKTKEIISIIWLSLKIILIIALIMGVTNIIVLYQKF